MDERHKWRIAKIALDAVGDRHDYVLTGSMALRAHGVTDRPIDDIDLFTLPDNDGIAARHQVAAALTRAGYMVEVEDVWHYSQSSRLSVWPHGDPEADATRVELVPIMTYFQPVEIDGLPVMAPEDCVYLKGECLRTRLDAKDYIDLFDMQVAWGAEFVDRHLSIGQGEERRHALRSLLGQVTDIPDESFARYNLSPYEAADLRHNMLAWADSLLPTTDHPLGVGSWGPAAGTHALHPEHAFGAWDRIEAHHPASLLNDHELAMQFVQAQATAQGALELAADAVADAGIGTLDDEEFRAVLVSAVGEESVEAMVVASALQDELQRRIDQPPEDRAAEAAIRREVKGMALAERPPSQAAVIDRVTEPAAHQVVSPPFQQEPYAAPLPAPPPPDLSLGI